MNNYKPSPLQGQRLNILNNQTKKILQGQPFPVETLPEPLKSYVVEGAKAIGCDPSMIALPALAACSGAVGTTRTIELKRGWTEPSILWLAVISPSGTMKSPAFDFALQAIQHAQSDRFKEYKMACDIFECEWHTYEADLARWKKTTPDKRGEMPKKPEPPVCVRHVVADCTIEALAPILSANPRGVLSARDELGAWLLGFNQYKGGTGSDVHNWLELHRAGTVTVDRKTGIRTIYIPRAAVSVCGTIQPGTMRRLLTPDYFECGLAARLLLARPPVQKKKWTEREVPVHIINRFEQTIRALLAIQHANGPDGDPVPIKLPLSTEAHEVWTAWFGECAELLANAPDDQSRAMLAKIEGGAARFALVCELVANVDATTIGADAMRAGVTLARWFIHEAKRVYGIWSESLEERELRELEEYIQQRGGSISVRDLQRGPRQFRGSANYVRARLNELLIADRGYWERPASGKQGGQPTEIFRLYDNTGDGDNTINSKLQSDVLSPSPHSQSELSVDKSQSEDVEWME